MNASDPSPKHEIRQSRDGYIPRVQKEQRHWTSLVREHLSYNSETGDLTYLTGHRAGRIVSTLRSTGTDRYLVAFVSRQKVIAHRAAWFLYYGEEPASIIDHIDRDGCNNRIANLRLANISQNAFNKGPRRNAKKHSVFKGVSRCKRWWFASVNIDGKQRQFYAKSEVEAARKYDEIVIKHAGEFALTNVMLGLLPPLEGAENTPRVVSSAKNPVHGSRQRPDARRAA